MYAKTGFEYFLDGMIIFLCMSLVALIFLGLPLACKNESDFMEACIQAGGVPSKYSTMGGKASERLCIKKENIVELK